jgi:uncharacterized membrane protein
MSKDIMEYPRSLLVLGNLALAFWIILGAIAFWFYTIVAFWLFLVFMLFIVYVVLRRLGCNTCAYCKSCTMGFGRLAGWFFGKRADKDTNNKSALAMVALVYLLLGPIATMLLSFSITQGFATSKIVVLLCLLAISLYSGITWRKNSRSANKLNAASSRFPVQTRLF